MDSHQVGLLVNNLINISKRWMWLVILPLLWNHHDPLQFIYLKKKLGFLLVRICILRLKTCRTSPQCYRYQILAYIIHYNNAYGILQYHSCKVPARSLLLQYVPVTGNNFKVESFKIDRFCQTYSPYRGSWHRWAGT